MPKADECFLNVVNGGPLDQKTRLIPWAGHFDNKLLWCTVLSVPSDCFHLIHQFLQNSHVIFVLCSLFLLISVIVDLGLKKIMSTIFSVMIKIECLHVSVMGGRPQLAARKRQRMRNADLKCGYKYNIIWKWKLLSVSSSLGPHGL